MIFDKLFKKDKDSSKTTKIESVSAVDYYAEGKKQFNAGQYTRAMEYFQAAIDYQPARESAYMKLAETYIKMGKEDLAKKTRLRYSPSILITKRRLQRYNPAWP